MLVGLLVKMLCLLVLCPVLLGAVQTLTIDSQLGTSVEDCFERISIGEQLPLSAIYRNVSELTTRECEQICKQDKQCQTYDYGVGAKGNATCDLSMLNEKELKEKGLIRRHPDYDVYIRRFQCEQSPPSPLQPQFDDPGDGPAHRPVFRPDEDEPKRPLDDYPTDSRPYETRPDLIKPIPPYRPYNNYIEDRPDDYFGQKPASDNPPSYGAHKPQDIPFKPTPVYDRPPSYGAHRPQEIPYKPAKPNHNQSLYKPDPYDVLQFQEPYKPLRPLDPGFWRPDPYNPPHLNDDVPDLYGPKPIRPSRPSDIPDPYGLERPQYHYIVRPNRRPKPDYDSGYGVHPLKPDYPSKPDPYGQQDIGHPSGPLGPPDPYRPSYDYPSRPHEKPSYIYDSQYASNYGQAQDNSIYLEIYDPPRPYRPPKRPENDRPSYGSGQSGYGQNYGYGDQSIYGYGSQSSHHSQSHSQSYGQGTITEIDNTDPGYHRPQDSGYRPQKPAYDNHNTGYGTSSSDTTQGYGSQLQKPSDTTQRPSYGSNQGYASNQNGHDHSDASYSSQTQSYGTSNRPSYGQDDNQSGYGLQKPQKPNDSTQKPSYGSNQGYGNQPSPIYDGDHGYGGSQGSYGSQQSYGYSEHQDSQYSSQQSSHSSGYGISRPPYSDRPSYSDNRPAYGDDRPLYGNDRPYGNEKPLYGNDKPSYGNDKPSYGDDRPLYDHNRPTYGNDRPSYGSNRPSYGNDRPSYENDRPSYENDRPSYGNNRPSYENDRPSYGNYRPSYGNDRPSYGNDKPSYDNDKPSYGNDRPSYGEKPSNKPSYGDTNRPNDNQRPGYGGSTKPSYDRPSYGDSKPSYDNRPSYETNQPSLDNNRPDPSYTNKPSYGNQDSNSGYGSQTSETYDYKNSGSKPDKPSQKPVGTRPNQTDLDRPNIKPVYEYELEKPNNVPSYILRPGGEVITSRPVTIGDYGEKPGQRREPGYPRIPLSYKGK